MKFILSIASLLGAAILTAAADPPAAEQVLVSNTWQIQIDSRPPMKIQFSSDGTATDNAKARWHWVATGPQSFTINGNNNCVFDQTFDKFVGHWSNKRGDHTMTGTPLTAASQDSANPSPPQQMAAPNGVPFDNPLDKPAYDQHSIWTSGNYYYLGRYYPWRYLYQGRYYYSTTTPGAASYAAPAQQAASPAPGANPANPLDRPAYDQRDIWTSGNYYYLGRYYPWRYWYQGRYYYSASAPGATGQAPQAPQAPQAAAPASTPSNPLDRPAY